MTKRIEEATRLFELGRTQDALAILNFDADVGDPGALALLGYHYFVGESVEVDGPRAERLLALAAALGNGSAAHNLGTLYRIGAPGVPPNKVLATVFYQRARALGCTTAPDAFYDESTRKPQP
jgi:TPR repeat protein